MPRQSNSRRFFGAMSMKMGSIPHVSMQIAAQARGAPGKLARTARADRRSKVPIRSATGGQVRSDCRPVGELADLIQASYPRPNSSIWSRRFGDAVAGTSLDGVSTSRELRTHGMSARGSCSSSAHPAPEDHDGGGTRRRTEAATARRPPRRLITSSWARRPRSCALHSTR